MKREFPLNIQENSFTQQLAHATVRSEEQTARRHEWEATFDLLPEALFLFDAYGLLRRVNSAGAVLENMARGRASASGRIEEAVTALLGKCCCEMFWRVENASECVVERALESGASTEVEMLTGVPETRSIIITVNPMRDGDGELTGAALVAARDVSELRRAEAEALEHKSFMASLADLAPDAIYALDASGRFTWMNERARAANGVTSSALFGRHFSEIISTETRACAEEALRRALTEGADAQCEAIVVRGDGTIYETEAHTSPLWRDGVITGALVFLRDVTERKRAQERISQSDKLRALGELAAGVAHNLNNSLTVIGGRAQLLLMRDKSADAAKARSLEVITRAVSDSAQTLKRMLDFARSDAAQEFAPVDLAELISSSVEIAKPKWQNAAVGRANPVTVRVEPSEPVYVYGEAAELREVVLNLLFNAVDAMPDGGSIEIGTRAEIDGACFWVADTGCGMSEETLARIFEPFYSTKGERGTGLGLSASHGIIRRHRGQIMAVSEPGEGTRFEVRLPLYDKSSVTKKPPVSFSTLAPTERARVLVVDDEEEVRSLLHDAFDMAGHAVVSLKTGAEALAQLKENEFDLVVTDIGLPEVSGLQVARWVKEHRPTTRLILATGLINMITPEDHEHGRIDAVIKKPYSIADVLERAAQLLTANMEDAPPQNLVIELAD